MDLFSLTPVKADTGSVLTLKNPKTEEPLPITITLLGHDSKKYQAIQRRKNQAALDRMTKNKRAITPNADKLTDEMLDDLIDLTVSWEGVSDQAGAKLECTPENVRRIYSQLNWVREQVQEFVGDRANFF